MPYHLRGRNVLVTGGSRGLGEIICLKFAQEGCNVAINFVSSADRAKVLGEKIEKHYGVKIALVQGDVGVEADCKRIVEETTSTLGGLDIVINNAGYTRFSTFSDLNAATNDDWDKCYAVNVKSQVFLMRAVESILQSNTEGGVFIMTSSIAGRTPAGSSMPYSVSKAAQLHLMKCLASTKGPKIRVNAVLPGFLATEWGNQYSQEIIHGMRERAWLKQDTDLEDCAQAFIDIAKNKSMTGQKIQIDSGLGQND